MVYAPRPLQTTQGLVNQLHRLRDEEDGGLIVFALVLFMLMVMMGGVALDIMRYETARTTLQNTLDRCTLMAASMKQQLDPQTVVTDCVTKAGLASQLKGVAVTQSATNREVVSHGLADTQPMFLHLIGINKLDATGVSGAMQGVGNVELSMVLDVSGSMTGSKIASLKTAAKDFVNTVLTGDTFHRVTISLVPFNGQVNLGAQLRAQYNVTDNPNLADVNCLDLPGSVYGSPSLSNTVALPMTGSVDSYSYTDNYLQGWAPGYYATNSGPSVPVEGNKWCPAKPGNIVRPLGNDITTLQNQIDGLTAVGATSINAGVKWGLAMLDPASKPVISNLIAQNVVPATANSRPYAYGDNTQKIIVVMTDGEHFAEERLNDGFRTGPSPIYKSATGFYSMYHPEHAGANKYWVPSNASWQATPFSGGVQQDWKDVWKNEQVSWVAWQLYARAAGGNQTAAFTNAINMIRTRTATPTMNTQLQSVCAQAKSRNVMIFGIAFEAPAGGQAQILQCATDQNHYFNAIDEAAMKTAFHTIAGNITQLKLTQ